MAEDPVKEQRIVIKFLVAEGGKAASIHKRLQNVYKDHCLKKRTVFKWVKLFKAGRKSIEDRLKIEDNPRSSRPSTSVTETNIQRVDQLIRADRPISVDQLEHQIGILRPSILEVVHERLGYSKVSSRWVPKMLSPTHKRKRDSCSEDDSYINGENAWL